MRKLIILLLILFFPALANSAIIQQDNFEYEASRTGTGADALITSGGWTAIKAINMTGTPNACGYLFTTTSIPGFSGSFPGQSSTRVLCSEHLPFTNNCDQGAGSCAGGRWLQSDTRFGYGSNSSRVLPANVWIQFWMYPQYYGDQLSRFNRGKFLYSCGENTYFSTCSTGGMDWMGIFNENQSYASECNTTAPDGQFYYSIDTQGHASFDDGGVCGETDTLGWNQGGNGYLLSNQWTLVKMNYNMSNASTPIFRMWTQPQGGTEWTLYAEWIGGTTEDVSWTAEFTSGQYWVSVLEMNDCFDMWMYFDDFVIATTEGDLPVYGAGGSSPAKVQGLTISGGSLI